MAKEETVGDMSLREACVMICRTGRFETGQGTCALVCLDQLGDPRAKGCPHALAVHRKFCRDTFIAALKKGI